MAADLDKLQGTWHVTALWPCLILLADVFACGARSSLGDDAVPCDEGLTVRCGSDVGACKSGTKTCRQGHFGECVGEIGPIEEVGNGIDDNCNGIIDSDCEIGDCKPTCSSPARRPTIPPASTYR